ncbi:MAG: spore cortex-lytic enzyme [Peptococcaceae bacterium]|nr:spore cortex-lytic enzyme [Peptococcaceae bacterium]
MTARQNKTCCLAALLLVTAGLLAVAVQAKAQPVLYWGSGGDDVYRVQQRLAQWGYYNGVPDGYYGYDTYRAVQEFQRNNGIAADGVVGPGTWEALGFSAGEPPEAPAVSRGAAGDRGDITLLARVIEGEAADEPLLGKVAVGAVILNRTKSASFPHSISEVIFQPDAFESVSNGQANRPVSRESLQAAQMAMSGYDPTGGSIYFWNPGKPVSPWVWSRNIVTQIGNHVFAR